MRTVFKIWLLRIYEELVIYLEILVLKFVSDIYRLYKLAVKSAKVVLWFLVKKISVLFIGTYLFMPVIYCREIEVEVGERSHNYIYLFVIYFLLIMILLQFLKSVFNYIHHKIISSDDNLFVGFIIWIILVEVNLWYYLLQQKENESNLNQIFNGMLLGLIVVYLNIWYIFILYFLTTFCMVRWFRHSYDNDCAFRHVMDKKINKVREYKVLSEKLEKICQIFSNFKWVLFVVVLLVFYILGEGSTAIHQDYLFGPHLDWQHEVSRITEVNKNLKFWELAEAYPTQPKPPEVGKLDRFIRGLKVIFDKIYKNN